jgi:predicted metal-dependent hydrolase
MQVEITKKRMKNMRIVIDNTTGAIRVSAPKWVSNKQIMDFVDSKKLRIEKVQEKYATLKEQFALPA